MNEFLADEIATQRRIVSNLKAEIFGIDKTFKSKYIRDFYNEFRDYKRLCTTEEVIDRASRADIVYFGDYHPLKESQDFVLRLMEELSKRGRRVVLAMELLYEHQQPILDRWMKGVISEEEFLRQIHFLQEKINQKDIKKKTPEEIIQDIKMYGDTPQNVVAHQHKLLFHVHSTHRMLPEQHHLQHRLHSHCYSSLA